MSNPVPASQPHLVNAQSDPHHEKRWLILVTVCLAQLMLLVDMSSVGVALEDVGVAGSLANVVQQIGPAIGMAILSTVAATATTRYATGHTRIDDLVAHATVHGFTVAFWYGTAIFAAAAVICTTLVRPGTRTGATSNPMEIEALANLEAA